MARVEYAFVTDNADRIVICVGRDLPNAGAEPSGAIRLHLGADDDEWDPEVADLTVEDAQALADLLGQAIRTAKRVPGSLEVLRPFGIHGPWPHR